MTEKSANTGYFAFDRAGSCRADHFLAEELPLFSRTSIRYLIDKQIVALWRNDKRQSLKKGSKLKMGDVIVWQDMPNISKLPIPNPDLPCDICFEDESLAVINKPAPLPCQPIFPWELDSLANGISHYYPMCRGIGDNIFDTGLLQRLDIGTSGLIMVAKNHHTYDILRQQIKQRLVEKYYTACVHNWIDRASMPQPLTKSLTHHPTDSRKMIIATNEVAKKNVFKARSEIIHCQYLGSEDSPYSLVKIHLHTGVMHQLRVHLSDIGHPIVGENIYCEHSGTTSNRYLLHAHKLVFNHPKNNKQVEVTSDLPEAMSHFIKEQNETLP